MFSLGLVVSTITVARIAISGRITPNDLTCHLAKLVLVTDPEPLLGIIVACAPLFRPTFEAMLEYKRRASPERPSGDLVRLASEITPGPQLRSFDDTYKLDDMEGGRNKTSLTGLNRQFGNIPGTRQPTIAVERIWEVRPTSIG